MPKENNPTQKPSLFFVNKEKEALFSKKNRALLSDPMDDNNHCPSSWNLFCIGHYGSA